MRSTLVALLFVTVACAPGAYSGSSMVTDDPDAGGGPIDDGDSPPPPPPDAGLPDAATGRSTLGLVTLHEFNEGLGPVVHDTSNLGEPTDLTVAQPGLTTWRPTGLRIDGATIIRSNAPATKVIDACRASNEITVEAWITPATADTGGVQQRVIGVSLNTDLRDFSLFQLGGDYQFALRTGTTNLDGDPPLVATGQVATQPQHVVFVRDTLGSARLYIDTVERAQATIGDTFANWDLTYEFFMANEGTLNRPWLGEFHLVAVYCRALTLGEIQRHYQERY